jgi:hypothetical protein
MVDYHVILEDTGFGGNGEGILSPPPKNIGFGENLILYVLRQNISLNLYLIPTYLLSLHY